MIAGLVGWYLALVSLAGVAAYAVWLEPRRRPSLVFLRPFALFVTLGIGHGLVTYVGEVFAPIAAPGSMVSRLRLYLLVDLVTIPLLAAMFAAFLWIRDLLGRRVSRLAWSALGVVEVIFLAALAAVTVTVFGGGRGGVVVTVAVSAMNAIIAGVAATAVLVLLLVRPVQDEVTDIARGLGITYGLSLTGLGTILLTPIVPPFLDRSAWAAVTATAVVLLNGPAVLYLRHRLAARPETVAGPEGESVSRLAATTGLSGREAEVLTLLIAGLDTRGIGERLFISPKTVKNHITSIYAKTGVKNRVQLANLVHASHPSGRLL